MCPLKTGVRGIAGTSCDLTALFWVGRIFPSFFLIGIIHDWYFQTPITPKKEFHLRVCYPENCFVVFFLFLCVFEMIFPGPRIQVGLCLSVSPLHSQGNRNTCLLAKLPFLLALSIRSSIWPFWEESFFSTANEGRISCWHLPEVPSRLLSHLCEVCPLCPCVRLC